MKKNGLVRLLALTSCVAILAGCGKDDPKIYVKDLPETFHLGETIDLDKYVTVKGTSKSFEVYIYKASKDLVSVKGHKITVKEEGKIKFSVYIGDVEKIIEVSSIAEMREALLKTFAEFDGEYLANGMLTGDTFNHRKEYGVRTRADYKNMVYIKNGIVSGENSDAGYEFYSDASGYYYGEPKIMSKSSFESLNHFTADIKNAKRGSVTLNTGETEVYTLTSSAIRNFTSSVMLTSPTAYTYSTQTGVVSEEDDTPVYDDVTTTISRVDFTVLEDGDDKEAVALIYGKVGTSTQLLDALTFTNKEEDLLDDAAGQYFAANPSDLVFKDSPVSSVNLLFTQVIPYFRSMVATFDYGWFDNTGARIDEPSDTPGTYFEGMPEGSVTRVLSQDAIVSIEDGKIVSGVIQDSGVVYDVSLANVGGELKHEIEVNPDYEEVYEDKYNSLSFIGEEPSLFFDSFYVSGQPTNVGTEELPVYQYTLLPNLKRHYDFLDGIFSCEDGAGKLVTFFYQYKDREFQKYFNLKILFTPYQTNSEGALHVEASLQWDDDGTQFYKIIFDLSYDSTHSYDSLISNLFTEVFGS